MPIKREQFDLQIDRLTDAFSERHFGDQRTHMIWEVVQDLEYVDVIDIVDSFIRSSKNAPLPIDFAKAAKGYKSTKLALGEKRPQDQANCFDCGDSGFVDLERVEEHEPWAKWPRGQGPCHCERGQELVTVARNRPERDRIEYGCAYNEQWARSYRIIPVYQKRETQRTKPLELESTAQ